MRPRTLSEAFDRIAAGQETSKAVSEFLDTYYGLESTDGRSAAIAAEPGLLADDRMNAFAAAIASYLGKKYRAQVPEWTMGAARRLQKPWFTVSNPDPAMIEYLVHSSPAEFRSRNIFTDSRPLRRASQAKLRARIAADGVASPDDGG